MKQNKSIQYPNGTILGEDKTSNSWKKQLGNMKLSWFTFGGGRFSGLIRSSTNDGELELFVDTLLQAARKDMVSEMEKMLPNIPEDTIEEKVWVYECEDLTLTTDDIPPAREVIKYIRQKLKLLSTLPKKCKHEPIATHGELDYCPKCGEFGKFKSPSLDGLEEIEEIIPVASKDGISYYNSKREIVNKINEIITKLNKRI